MKRKVIGIIPARGGSKGIPNKNIALLNGKPLISYTIDSCKNSILSDFYCSTDSEEIAIVSEKYGCKTIKRPPKLATDKTSMLSVVKHFRDYLNNKNAEFNAIMVLYPTYPLRKSDLINDALSVFDNIDDNCSLIGMHSPYTHPYLCYKIGSNDKLSQVLNFDINRFYRRQDYPECYEISHVISILPKSSIETLNFQLYNEHTKGYIVQDKHQAINIDDSEDLKYAEFLIQTNSL